jgi:autotransporter-associated beta strand protein
LLTGTTLTGVVLFTALAGPALADGGSGGNPGGGQGGIGFMGDIGNNASGAGGGGGGASGSPGGQGGTGGGGIAGGPGGAAAGDPGQPGGFGAGPGFGGGGGGGGADGTFGGVVSITNTSPLTGGNGGDGGPGGPGLAGGGGGGGGGGGYGAIIVGNGANSNTSTISGGSGGNGGGASGSGAGGGGGGDGGQGVLFTTSGASFTNSGSVTGGNGGAAGTGAVAESAGKGGAGITGSGLTIINSGSVTGGLSGDGMTRANAITFTGGANTLTLQAGSNLTGNIDVTGSLTFNQPTDATVSNVITGTGSVAKTGAGVLFLSGNNTYTGATTINAGTLALSGFGNISSSSSVTVGSGATFDVSASSFFFVPITTLAGSGTVQLGGNGLVITNGSTEFSGAINGSGGLEILTGTQTLSGANGYSGPTQIDRGATLALKGAGSIASTLYVGFNPLGSGLATFDISQTTAGASVGGLADGVGIGRVSLGSQTLTITNGSSFAGVIQDGGIAGGTGGNLVISAPGFGQDLSGVNTYTGSTTITANALLTLSGNGSISSSSGLILSGTGATFDISASSGNQTIRDLSGVAGSMIQLGANSLTVGTANSTTFAGSIDGSGGLVKQGTGALQLSGTNTYTGATTVNAGTLIVNGSIASSALTVNAGAMLAGTGTVGATTIMSGGTFAPGNSPGTMTVQGNLAFQSGAIYLVQVTPSLASSANVTAGGSAALAGTVNASFASGSYITRTYTILSAAGGLAGTTFNALTTSNLPAGFSANLSYSATDVILNLTATLGQPSGPAALGTSGLSINQKNVANSLNTFFNSGGALPPNFVTVFGLTGGALGNALSSLSGEAATGAQQAAFQIGNQFLGLMLDPFVDGRGGVGGAGGPALGFAPEQEALPDSIVLAYSKVLKAPAMPAATFDQRWTAWGGAYGGGNKTSGDPAVLGSHDLTATTAGFAAGLDYRLSPNSVVGVALAGGGTNWSLAQGLGGGRSDAFQAGVYGATRWGAAYLAGAFAFTDHWMSTDRFSFAADHLTASFNAQSYGGRVEGGYRFATWYGGVTPYAAIQVQSFHTPGYSEVDGSGLGFGLAYNARTGTDTRSELGARFDRVLALYSNAVLALRGRLAWAHDWVSDPTLAALFQTLPGASFVVNGATPVKDSALVSAGTEYRLANGVTLLAKFDGEFASRSTTYAGTGTVRYAW